MRHFKVNDDDDDDICMAAAGRTFLASKTSKENKKGVVLGQANID